MKKIIALLMALAMIVSAFHVSAFAEDGGYISGEDTGSNDPGQAMRGLFTTEHIPYVSGRTAVSIAPDADLTRSEAVLMLYRLLDEGTKERYAGSESAYSDIPEDAWYADAVVCLSEIGLVKGYSDGTFRPNNKITRGELVVLLSRCILEPGTDGAGFTDQVPGWAESDVLRAQAAGVVSGYPDGSFQFNRNVSRAEAMSLINRLFDRNCYADSENDTVYEDLKPTHWAYAAILEATQVHDEEMDEWSPDIL